jgi:hypothetical protein
VAATESVAAEAPTEPWAATESWAAEAATERPKTCSPETKSAGKSAVEHVFLPTSITRCDGVSHEYHDISTSDEMGYLI